MQTIKVIINKHFSKSIKWKCFLLLSPFVVVFFSFLNFIQATLKSSNLKKATKVLCAACNWTTKLPVLESLSDKNLLSVVAFRQFEVCQWLTLWELQGCWEATKLFEALNKKNKANLTWFIRLLMTRLKAYPVDRKHLLLQQKVQIEAKLWSKSSMYNHKVFSFPVRQFQ